MLKKIICVLFLWTPCLGMLDEDIVFNNDDSIFDNGNTLNDSFSPNEIFGDFAPPDTLLQNTRIGNILNHPIKIESLKIASFYNLPEITIQTDGYDLIAIIFFAILLKVEHTFYNDFYTHIATKLVSNFEKKITDFIKSMTCNIDEQTGETVLTNESLDHFCNLFEIRQINHTTLIKIVGKLIVSQWILLTAEKMTLPDRGFGSILKNSLSQEDHTLQNNIYPAYPIRIIIASLKSMYLDQSVFLTNIRPLLLALTQGAYPEDSFYHNFLHYLNKTTDNTIFWLIKEIFIWWAFFKQSLSVINTGLKEYLIKNNENFATYLKNISTAQSIEKSIYIEKLKSFINDSIQQSLFSFIKNKQHFMIRTNQTIESLLLLPVFIEIGKKIYQTYMT